MIKWHYLKALKQPSQKFWPKILRPYFFYSNLYLHFLRPCCENIFKIVCIVQRKLENRSHNLLCYSSLQLVVCLQSHWNWKYFSSAVMKLRGWLFMGVGGCTSYQIFKKRDLDRRGWTFPGSCIFYLKNKLKFVIVNGKKFINKNVFPCHN